MGLNTPLYLPSWYPAGINSGFADSILPKVTPLVVPAPDCCIKWLELDSSNKTPLWSNFLNIKDPAPLNVVGI